MLQSNISSVRCFMTVLRNDNLTRQLKMLQVVDVDLLTHYVTKIRQMPYCPKTKLSKIEGLKYSVKWIGIKAVDESFFGIPYYTVKARCESSVGYLESVCSALRPASKLQERRRRTISVQIDNGRFLNSEQIGKGMRKLSEFIAELDLKAYKPTIKTFLKFQSLFIFSFFILLPTQRRQVLANALASDFEIRKETSILSIHLEKNSHYGTNIDRKLPIYGQLNNLLIFLDKLRGQIFRNKSISPFFIITGKGKRMNPTKLTDNFTKFSREFFGLIGTYDHFVLC